jgi:CubicO group peptidase (beta-lactamase class C family)
MQCVERRQLDLNGDIAEVLPEWKNAKILAGFDERSEAIFRPATKTITLRQVIVYICFQWLRIFH